jgi:hypothetical protein
MTRAALDPSLKEAIQVGTPVELFDPATNECFYVLSADQFRAMAATVSGDMDPREAYPIVDRIMAEDDANDPLLDSYQ